MSGVKPENFQHLSNSFRSNKTGNITRVISRHSIFKICLMQISGCRRFTDEKFLLLIP